MFTVSDFAAQYENYTDEQLAFIHSNPDNYSKEAGEAAIMVIEKRGGLDALFDRLKSLHIKQAEINRIKKETEELGAQGFDSSFLKSGTTSEILSKEEMHEIIDNKYDEVLHNIEDRKITPKTISGSIVGGLIAAVSGGILWGLQSMYLTGGLIQAFVSRIIILLLIGLGLWCYGIIRFFTGQSKNNTAVFIATGISAFLVVFIGAVIYSIFGFQE